MKPRWKFFALILCLPLLAGLAWYLWAAFAPAPYFDMDSQEVFASHLLALQEREHLLNIQSDDPSVVQSWLRSRLDFSVPVRDLSASGFTLVGGRLDYMHDRPVAALVYRREGRMIELFIWPGETREHPFERDHLNLEPWNDNGMEFWAISDLNDAELSQFSAAFKTSHTG
jgi:anti-sigma factor RsiW